MKKIEKIRTGGQTGVDRAALDTARKLGIPIVGWCPKNGWAEDFPTAPGVRALFPELTETPLSDVNQRTRWNVRDSHATLVINPTGSSYSDGTSVTEIAARNLKRPLFVARKQADLPYVLAWLNSLGDELTLNVGGPRASECPEAYDLAMEFLQVILCAVNDN